MMGRPDAVRLDLAGGPRGYGHDWLESLVAANKLAVMVK